MVCKHVVCKNGKILTAATPRLEQRFDADLKEDRILQAQHGGSQKLGFTRRYKFYTAPVTFISQNPKQSTLSENIQLTCVPGTLPSTGATERHHPERQSEELLRKESREVSPVPARSERSESSLREEEREHSLASYRSIPPWCLLPTSCQSTESLITVSAWKNPEKKRTKLRENFSS